MVRNIPAGYDFNFCYKCVSAIQPNGIEFISKVILLKCDNSLAEDSSSAVSSVIPYDSSSSTTAWSAGWDSIFKKVTEYSICPEPTSCELLDSGGSTTMTGPNIVLSNGTPWSISVKQDIPAGYTESFVFKCSSPS